MIPNIVLGKAPAIKQYRTYSCGTQIYQIWDYVVLCGSPTPTGLKNSPWYTGIHHVVSVRLSKRVAGLCATECVIASNNDQ